MKKLSNFFLTFIFFIFFLIKLLYSGFVPIWDGRTYLNCLLEAVRLPFNIINFNCTKVLPHVSFLYIFIMSIGQYISIGNIFLLHLTSALLGALAIYAFYKINQKVFSNKYQHEILILTLLFTLNPSYLSNSLNLNLDYGVTVFLLPAIASILYGRFFLFFVFSTLMIFSKESGIIFYFFILFFYGLFFLRKKLKIKHIYLIFPAFIFWLYLQKSSTLFGIEISTSGFFYLISQLPFFRNTFINYLYLIFVTNFNWILSSILVIKLVNILFNYFLEKKAKKILTIDYTALSLIFWIFVCSVIILTSYDTFTNLRYFLPLLPLFLIIFLYATISINIHKKVRLSILYIILLLMIFQNFKTIDPVSKIIFGTFNFGKHKMLKMTSITNECCGYGRDQLVYNLEFTNFHYLQNKIYEGIKPDEKTYIVSHDLSHFFFTGPLNRHNFHRTLKTGNIFAPNYFTVNEIESLKIKPKKIFFVEYPNFDNKNELTNISRYYNLQSVKYYDNFGYSIPVYNFEIKN